MLMVESQFAAAVRFSAINSDSSAGVLPYPAAFLIPPNKHRRCGGWLNSRDGIKAAAAKEQLGSDSSSFKLNAKSQRYHPLEEISESELLEAGEARLTPAEVTRTIIEVNSKATLMSSGMMNEDVGDIFWPDLPYVTDEYGNIYFQVKNDEDILHYLTTEESVVHVTIGLGTSEMIGHLEALGHSEIDFGIDELDDENSDLGDYEDNEEEDDDNYEKDWVSIVDEDNPDEDFDESFGNWAKLETMQYIHPLYFAQRLEEVVSDVPVDCMGQPSVGLALKGILLPTFSKDHTNIRQCTSGPGSSDIDTNHIIDQQMQEVIVGINGQRKEKELAQDITWDVELKDETLGNGYAFYKLHIIKIQLVSSHGDQSCIEIEKFRMARPDAIAHATAKIISHLKSGGEETMQALKSLCWRCKGVEVEECALIGLDSLGFDLRVCCGRQIQTLRFPFKKQALSEYSAERQLNDFLFPTPHKFHQERERKQHQSQV